MADFVLEALFNIKRKKSSNKNKRRLKKEVRKKEQNSIFVTFICNFFYVRDYSPNHLLMLITHKRISGYVM